MRCLGAKIGEKEETFGGLLLLIGEDKTDQTLENGFIMKKEEAIKKTKKARYLHISIPYNRDEKYGLLSFDDGLITELECEEDFVPPMLNVETLRLELIVDLYERKVINWGDDKDYIRMWAKVCDSGTYTLLDADMKPIMQINGYVPNAMIPPYENGFGDYLELAIEPDGTLPHWQTIPDFSDFIEEGEAPQPIKTNKWHHAEDAYRDVMRHKLNKEEMIWLLQKLLKGFSLDLNEIV